MGTPGNPRVLLVPGATGSKEDFVLMLPELAAAGYFVLSCDIAGQFESAAAGPEHLSPPRAHQDYGLFTDELITLLDADDGPAHVVEVLATAPLPKFVAVGEHDLWPLVLHRASRSPSARGSRSTGADTARAKPRRTR